MSCARASRSRALPKRKLTIEQYLAFPHVLVGSLESGHHQIEDSFRKRNIHRQIALQVPHFTVVPHILAHTDWIVTLPRRTVELLNPAGAFAVYDLPVEIPDVRVTVHWHADFDTHDANRWIRTLVIEQLSDAPAQRCVSLAVATARHAPGLEPPRPSKRIPARRRDERPSPPL
jgi:DNA-binding transcriptional LysR family regulator